MESQSVTNTEATKAGEEKTITWLQKKKRSNLDPVPPPLPLDWTRVKRRRDDDDDCCPPIGISALRLEADQKIVKGLGVFCLHDDNPQWFQGYFFPTGNNKPWGILARQEELDDCMRSADGGYRRCTLTVYPFPAKRKQVIPGVEWTGGDMMRLSNEKVSLEPDQLITGEQAVPHVEKLFASILAKCRANLDEGEPSGVLDLLPEVVVISGPMQMIVSKKKDDEEATKSEN